MTEPVPLTSSQDPGPASGEDEASRVGVFLGWVLPIALGAGLGFLVLFLWKARRGPVHQLVDKWDINDWEENDRLAEEIRKLGPEVREDLVEEFKAIDGKFVDWKLWTGALLGGEPFYDTATLREIATSGARWDSRVAAAALVDLLPDEELLGLAETLLPPLVGWLADTSVIDHSIPLRAVERLTADGAPRPDVRDAVLKLADPKERPLTGDPEDDSWILEDRESAVAALGPFIPDQLVVELLWSLAENEKEDQFVRVMAVRVLSENRVLDDVERWAGLGETEDDVVRQTVAENLSRARDPAMNKVLAPLCFDAHPLVRTGAIDAQTQRGMPTFLPRIAELLEDHEVSVVAQACLAIPRFTKHEGAGARNGMLLRIAGESDRPDAVEAAVIALLEITGDHAGFGPDEIKPRYEEVDPAALASFMQSASGRKAAVDRWQDGFKGTAVWLDTDREKALAALLEHADAKNVERAKSELAKLR